MRYLNVEVHVGGNISKLTDLILDIRVNDDALEFVLPEYSYKPEKERIERNHEDVQILLKQREIYIANDLPYDPSHRQ